MPAKANAAAITTARSPIPGDEVAPSGGVVPCGVGVLGGGLVGVAVGVIVGVAVGTGVGVRERPLPGVGFELATNSPPAGERSSEWPSATPE